MLNTGIAFDCVCVYLFGVYYKMMKIRRTDDDDDDDNNDENVIETFLFYFIFNPNGSKWCLFIRIFNL